MMYLVQYVVQFKIEGEGENVGVGECYYGDEQIELGVVMMDCCV